MTQAFNQNAGLIGYVRNCELEKDYQGNADFLGSWEVYRAIPGFITTLRNPIQCIQFQCRSFFRF